MSKEIVTIKEDVEIGDVILEAGDRILVEKANTDSTEKLTEDEDMKFMEVIGLLKDADVQKVCMTSIWGSKVFTENSTFKVKSIGSALKIFSIQKRGGALIYKKDIVNITEVMDADTGYTGIQLELRKGVLVEIYYI